MTATDLLKYLSQTCKLLNILFWCQSSLVCLSYCWHYFQSLNLKRAWLKWSQFHPTQYLHKLHPRLFFSSLVPLYLNFFSFQKTFANIRYLWNSHISLVIHWGTLFYTVEHIAADKAHIHVVFVVHMQRSVSVSPEAVIPVHCMSLPPVVCVLMNVFPLNSGMKTLLKEMPSLIPNMPLAALSHSVIHCHIRLHSFNYSLMLSFLPLFAKV